MLRFTENVTLRFVLNSTIYGHCTGNLINIYTCVYIILFKDKLLVSLVTNNFYKYDLLEICSIVVSSLLAYSSQEISSPKDKRKLRKRIVVHKYDLRAKG